MPKLESNSSAIKFNINYRTQYGQSVFLIIYNTQHNIFHQVPMNILDFPNIYNNCTKSYGQSEWSVRFEFPIEQIFKMLNNETISYYYVVNNTDCQNPNENYFAKSQEYFFKKEDIYYKQCVTVDDWTNKSLKQFKSMSTSDCVQVIFNFKKQIQPNERIFIQGLQSDLDIGSLQKAFAMEKNSKDQDLWECELILPIKTLIQSGGLLNYIFIQGQKYFEVPEVTEKSIIGEFMYNLGNPNRLKTGQPIIFQEIEFDENKRSIRKQPIMEEDSDEEYQYVQYQN